jgi:hypothetical protein
VQKKPEFAKLNEIAGLPIAAVGGLLGQVEGALDRRLAVEQVVALQHVPHAAVHLTQIRRWKKIKTRFS